MFTQVQTGSASCHSIKSSASTVGPLTDWSDMRCVLAAYNLRILANIANNNQYNRYTDNYLPTHPNHTGTNSHTGEDRPLRSTHASTVSVPYKVSGIGVETLDNAIIPKTSRSGQVKGEENTRVRDGGMISSTLDRVVSEKRLTIPVTLTSRSAVLRETFPPDKGNPFQRSGSLRNARQSYPPPPSGKLAGHLVSRTLSSVFTSACAGRTNDERFNAQTAKEISDVINGNHTVISRPLSSTKCRPVEVATKDAAPITGKTTVIQASTSELLNCFGEFLYRSCHKRLEYFSPTDPIIWLRTVDRSLLASGLARRCLYQPGQCRLCVHASSRTCGGQCLTD